MEPGLVVAPASGDSVIARTSPSEYVNRTVMISDGDLGTSTSSISVPPVTVPSAATEPPSVTVVRPTSWQFLNVRIASPEPESVVQRVPTSAPLS